MNTLGSLWNKTTVGKLNEKRVFCLPPLSDPEPPVELNSEEEHGDEGDDDSGGEDCSSPNPKNDIITTGHNIVVLFTKIRQRLCLRGNMTRLNKN